MLGLLLGLAWLTLFGGPAHTERSPGPILLRFMVLGIFGPYLWTEGLTRIVGAPLDPLVGLAWTRANAPGQLNYFRVTSYSRTRVRILAIGKDVDDSGFTDQPVVSVVLERQGTQWELESADVLCSNRTGKYGLVIPPYH